MATDLGKSSSGTGLVLEYVLLSASIAVSKPHCFFFFQVSKHCYSLTGRFFLTIYKMTV